MARVMRIVSDISGSDNAQEYTYFNDEGEERVIALTPREYYNFKRTRQALKNRMEKWDSISKPKNRVTTSTFNNPKEHLSDSFFVRNWAKSEGYDIGDRGIIPAYIWGEWRKAGCPRSADK